jgi:hypothetical protein
MSAPPKRITQQELERLRELGRSKSCRDPALDQISGFTTSWGMDNGMLGYNKSTMKVVMEEVASRVNRGEVKRYRPMEEAFGRNIKYGARHSASTCVMSPNYGELDPRRIAKEQRIEKALAVAYGKDNVEPRMSWVGAGGFGPWGGSLPCFTELHNNVLTSVPQRERP